jgi:hypothetical protein
VWEDAEFNHAARNMDAAGGADRRHCNPRVGPGFLSTLVTVEVTFYILDFYTSTSHLGPDAEVICVSAFYYAPARCDFR